MAAVNRSITVRWSAAVERAAAAEGEDVGARVRSVRASFVRELAAVGGVSGGVAAVPAAGTATSLAVAAAELGWITVRLADMILTIAAVHGLTESSVEERRAWVLAVLVAGDNAALVMAEAARGAGKGIGRRAGRAVPVTALRGLNRTLAQSFVTKYGARRQAIAVGTALPFGVGAVVGGAANAAMARTIGRQADRLFRSLNHSALTQLDSTLAE